SARHASEPVAEVAVAWRGDDRPGCPVPPLDQRLVVGGRGVAAATDGPAARPRSACHALEAVVRWTAADQNIGRADDRPRGPIPLHAERLIGGAGKIIPSVFADGPALRRGCACHSREMDVVIVGSGGGCGRGYD